MKCRHCGLEVYEKVEPRMDGNHLRWWVHDNGSYMFCHPQLGIDSPRAEPEFS